MIKLYNVLKWVVVNIANLLDTAIRWFIDNILKPLAIVLVEWIKPVVLNFYRYVVVNIYKFIKYVVVNIYKFTKAMFVGIWNFIVKCWCLAAEAFTYLWPLVASWLWKRWAELKFIFFATVNFVYNSYNFVYNIQQLLVNFIVDGYNFIFNFVYDSYTNTINLFA